MNSTIVVLLILLIIFQFSLLYRDSQTATKESALRYYKQKIEDQEKFKGGRAIVFLALLATRSAIIYYAVVSILSFIK